MSAKHTPGPWRLTDDPVRRVIKGGTPERTVCIIEDWTTEPDAKLIAAAPDMADALGEMTAMLDACTASDINVVGLDHFIDRAREALAKAGMLP